MVKIAVLGCGVVGSGVIEIVHKNAILFKRSVGKEVRVSKVLDLRVPRMLPDYVKHTTNIQDIILDEEIAIVVEAMGGVNPTFSFAQACIKAGKHYITSNKQLVVEKGDELQELANEHGVLFLFEASVGGGIPIVHPIHQCLAANNIISITGILNGTTNYILTRMNHDKMSFSVALAEAQSNGYAEKDPTSDIDGSDTRRKLAILAHEAYGSSFTDEALIPTYGITRITHHDMEMAIKLGYNIKLIAYAHKIDENWSGWVGPALVSRSHPLYGVSDVFNAIVIKGDMVDEVLFHGRGAGSLPTASAVAGDIIEAARHLNAVIIPRIYENKPIFTTETCDDDDCFYALRISDGATEVLSAIAGNKGVMIKDTLKNNDTIVVVDKNILSKITNMAKSNSVIRLGQPMRMVQ